MSVDLARLSALAGQLKERTAVRREPTAKRPWKIMNQATDLATVYIYDDIGQDVWGDGISASEFAAEMSAISAPRMDIRFNSRGGSVWDGIAMYETLKRHPAEKVAYVDSLAASAASVIMLACDTVVIAEAGRIMIHDASGGAYIEGSATEVRASIKAVEELADLLDSLSNSIAEIYAEKAGGTTEEWRAVMSSDKFYKGSEAVAAGLADYVGALPVEQEDQAPATASLPGTINLTNTAPGDNVEGLREALKGAFA